MGKGPTKGLENTLSAEKMYSIDFKGNNKKLCLNFYYNGENSSLFVNSKEIFKFKAKNSEIVAIPLWLGNFLKDWSLGNMKNAGLNGYVYDFSVDYDAIAVDDMSHIHSHLTKKNDIVFLYFDLAFLST